MVQTLLEDRFRLKTHREMKDVAVYDLVLAKESRKEPRLHEVSSDAAADPGVRINGAVQQVPSEKTAAAGWPISRIISYLSDRPELGSPVIDKTGLNGIYAFTLDFSLGDGDERPGIFTALQE